MTKQQGASPAGVDVGMACMFLREGFGDFLLQMPQRERVMPEEIWIPAMACWVRVDGSCIHVAHNEPNAGYYYPGHFNRWRLRQAVKAFRRLKDRTDALCKRLGLSADAPNPTPESGQ